MAMTLGFGLIRTKLTKFQPRFVRNFSTSNYLLKKKDDDYVEVQPPERIHPMERVKNIVKNDFKQMFDPEAPPLDDFSTHVDIAIIGGGVMGSAIAYFLKERIPRAGLKVLVIEKDPSYSKSSTVLSAGGVRTQFSLKENVEMSLFGAEFLRNAPKHLAVEDSPGPDMHFHPQGYLYIASEAGAEQLHKNQILQTSLGAKVELLSPTKLKERFPWINTDDIALATHGIQHEGWFDPWSLLYGFKRKAMALDVEYVQAEVVGFEFRSRTDLTISTLEEGEPYEGIDKILIKTTKGELKTVKFAFAIVAAGHESGKIAEMARIGRGEQLLSVPLPVEPRKRYVYHYHAPDKDGPGLNCPMVIDHTGAYFRREGLANYFICGQSPPNDEEPETETLDVDYSFFDNVLWPNIANRCPAFNNVKIKSAWAGYYDYNYFDQNAIIGGHPFYYNLYFACGFSGHGIQQAPAVGRAIAEMILDGEFRNIDLSRFAWDRLIVGRKVVEKNIL
ncbi:unnamed protein product [Allacma fusca]|uniref:FAD-dependent oxidoreductase domain-containing protein 1 n=1 Tax=Allacma fusca TaxID=39272 RepID=A0A8J2J345_9HEXA|nr:unnamed protein product [Allacma fusca]